MTDDLTANPGVTGSSQPGTYRKRPVEIQAVQWTGRMADVIALVGRDLPTYGESRSGSLRIETLEGDMECAPGDWIIRGVKGEFYPCKARHLRGDLRGGAR